MGRRQVRSLPGVLIVKGSVGSGGRRRGRAARHGAATSAYAGSTPAVVSVAVAQPEERRVVIPEQCGFESHRSPLRNFLVGRDARNVGFGSFDVIGTARRAALRWFMSC